MATNVRPPTRRRTWIVALIVGLVLLCGLSSCAVLLLVGDDDAEAVATAEQHYGAILAHTSAANDQVKSLKLGDAATGQKTLDGISKELRSGRDELAAAKVAIESIDDSQGKTDYLSALGEITTALEGLEGVVDYLGTANAMTASLAAAGSSGGKAADDLNDAISAGNSRDYAEMRTKAQAAAKGFEKAAALFAQAHAADKSAGLDKVAAYLRKRAEQANVVIAMAAHGKSGRTSSYNTAIDKMNRLAAQAEKIGDPDIVSDSQWTEKRIGQLTASAVTAAERADELHEKAMAELD